jgi:hypothetical protein
MIATQQADCVDNQKRLAQLEALVAHFTQIARPHTSVTGTDLASTAEAREVRPVLTAVRYPPISDRNRQ